MSVTDITTVAVKPVEVHLHTLRFQKKSLTPALYRQIPTALPFSAEWTLDADLLGWVNVPGRSDHAEWHLLFTRDQRLLSCHLPVRVESFEAYRKTSYAIHDYTKILRPLLWAFAVTHRLRHAPDEAVASATNPDYTIRVTAGGIDETMTLDTDDLFWSLPPVSDPSNASPVWTHDLQRRFENYVWRPLAYADAHAIQKALWDRLQIPSHYTGYWSPAIPPLDQYDLDAPWWQSQPYLKAAVVASHHIAALKTEEQALRTLWTTLTSRVASLPQIYLGL